MSLSDQLLLVISINYINSPHNHLLFEVYESKQLLTYKNVVNDIIKKILLFTQIQFSDIIYDIIIQIIYETDDGHIEIQYCNFRCSS